MQNNNYSKQEREQIEMEARFFFPTVSFNHLYEQIERVGAKFEGRFYELTVMYDNPNPDLTFYSDAVDGRLRFRTSRSTPLNWQNSDSTFRDSSKITWKRRLANVSESPIRKEEEIEVHLSPADSDNMVLIFETILGCKRMSSYERYRNTFTTPGLSITLDEFPYGLMLEIELLEGEENQIYKFMQKLNLETAQASNLSCDDKYVQLCRDQNITPQTDILFKDGTMPRII